MPREIQVTPRSDQTPEREGSEASPLDLSDVAVKSLINGAKKRGYAASGEINASFSSEDSKSEQVVEAESHVGAEEETERKKELVEAQRRPVPVKRESKDPAERTDDPVRMYLRDMGTLKLLSRAGEIAIAKRFEAGRETMLLGLCESPLTFQAITIWREELNEGKVYLRDVIELDATQAGLDSEAVPAPVFGPNGTLIVGVTVPGVSGRLPRVAAPTTAKITYLEHRWVEIADEILRYDEVAIELATEPLDAARQIDVGTDHGEIKSVTSSNVAIRDFAIVEGPATQPRLSAMTYERLRTREKSLKNLTPGAVDSTQRKATRR